MHIEHSRLWKGVRGDNGMARKKYVVESPDDAALGGEEPSGTVYGVYGGT
jgi:hypothetical protein